MAGSLLANWHIAGHPRICTGARRPRALAHLAKSPITAAGTEVIERGRTPSAPNIRHCGWLTLLLNATMTQATADGLRSRSSQPASAARRGSRQRGQITAGGQLLAYCSHRRPLSLLRVWSVYAPVTGLSTLGAIPAPP